MLHLRSKLRFAIPMAFLCTALCTLQAWSQKPEDQPQGPALEPAAAAQSFTIPEGLKWTQLLADPIVRQPLFATFDARGRLWVVQYLQYPEPAGIKALSRDNYWRIVYDRLPKPPGQDVQGADRITVFDDADGDGKYTEVGDFVNGLNIATSVLPTSDGAWVLQPPYLLFYRDADGDLKADGPPEVHLEGFGMEDTHSVVNNLCMGPDGWLYAAQGSTVSGAVRAYGSSEKPHKTLGQLIWRYHPQKRIYEVFAEGGGNAFGVAFDDQGRVYSGHNGGDTRGFHYVQGGYFQKGFTKHGSLSNPYALGYLSQMKHERVQRFSHTMLLTDGTVLSEKMKGSMLCVDPLHGTLVHTQLQPEGSTFQTKDIDIAVKSSDKWFRPVAIADGPDGAAYVSDWYDSQVAHIYAHVGKLDKDHGRLYRLATADTPVPAKAWDGTLATGKDQVSLDSLVQKLSSPLRWQRWQARVLIARHPLRESAKDSLVRLAKSTEPSALDALWTLHGCGWLDDCLATNSNSAPSQLVQPADFITHTSPHVRAWAVRLAADDHDISALTQQQIEKLAATEQDPVTLSQIACSARRLPSEKCLQVCQQLLNRDLPEDDPHLSLLIWWAIEQHADKLDLVKRILIDQSSLYEHGMYQQQIAPRIVERAGMIGTDKQLAQVANIFSAINALKGETRAKSAKASIAGFERAFAGRSLSGVPDSVLEQLASLGQPSLALQLRRGDKNAQAEAAKLLVNAKADQATRVQVARILGEVPAPEALDSLLTVLADKKAKMPLRVAAASSLASYKSEKIAEQIIANWSDWPADLRASAGAMLVSKPAGAAAWLQAVEDGKLKANDLPLEVVRMLRLHNDAALLARVDKHYPPIGKVDLPTAQKKAAEISQIILQGNGDPYRGKKLYSESCGRCHVLFDQGGLVGPNLTGYQRDQLNGLLINVLAPNLEIREGFQAMALLTADGKLINGFIERETDAQVTIRSIDGQTHLIEKEDIESLKPQPASLMPEGLLDNLTNEQLCDLFAYLRSSQPLNDSN